MITILALLALAVVLSAMTVLWVGLRSPADEPPTRLHHTTTCSCPHRLEEAPA